MTLGAVPAVAALARRSREREAQHSQLRNTRSSFLDARIRLVNAKFNSAFGLRDLGGAVTIENTVFRSSQAEHPGERSRPLRISGSLYKCIRRRPVLIAGICGRNALAFLLQVVSPVSEPKEQLPPPLPKRF